MGRRRSRPRPRRTRPRLRSRPATSTRRRPRRGAGRVAAARALLARRGRDVGRGEATRARRRPQPCAGGSDRRVPALQGCAGGGEVGRADDRPRAVPRVRVPAPDGGACGRAATARRRSGCTSVADGCSRRNSAPTRRPRPSRCTEGLLEAPSGPVGVATELRTPPDDEPPAASTRAPESVVAPPPAASPGAGSRRGFARGGRRVVGLAAAATLAAVGIAALVLSVAVPLLGGGSDHSEGSAPSPGSGSNVMTAIDPSTGRPTGSVPLEGSPAAVAYGQGSVWATMPNRDAISRIDPKTKTVQQTIGTGSAPTGDSGRRRLRLGREQPGRHRLEDRPADERRSGGRQDRRRKRPDRCGVRARRCLGGELGRPHGRANRSAHGQAREADPGRRGRGRDCRRRRRCVGDERVRGSPLPDRALVRERDSDQRRQRAGRCRHRPGSGLGREQPGRDGVADRSGDEPGGGHDQVGEGPSGVAVAPGGASVWVSNELSGTLSKIDPSGR